MSCFAVFACSIVVFACEEKERRVDSPWLCVGICNLGTGWLVS